MLSSPYAGIVGVQTTEQIAAARWQRPINSTRQLMIAARLKIVREGLVSNINEKIPYTNLSDATTLFSRFSEHLNLFSLSVKNPIDALCLDQLMVSIYERATGNWNGFEITCPWPSIGMLESYRRQTGKQTTIVVRTPITISGRSPEKQELADRVHAYADTVNTVVLDFGRPGNDLLDIERAAEYLRALYAARRCIGIGIAGGIGPDNVAKLQPLLAEFPGLSFEADICLHGFDHRLDPQQVIKFTHNSFHLGS